MLVAHPLAGIVPEMTAAEYAKLLASIQANGLREPVTLYRDGRLLDGRHRARACEELGLPVATRLFEGEDSDLIDFVLDLNIRRRHLDESQRAMVAARLENVRRGRPGKDAILQVFRADAADLLNVSPRSVASARQVLDRGTPELVRTVDAGSLTVSRAVQVATMPATRQAEVVGKIQRGARATHAVLTATRTEKAQQIERASAAQPLAGLGRKYPVIYADPPWSFETWTPAGGGRAAEQHYPCMTLEDICALPVAEIAADDAVLFLWATAPMLPEALQVVGAWGFTYKTHGVWSKDQIGLGYWFRNQHEDLIVATRGKMPPPAHARSSVFHAPSGRHSEKPACVRDWIRDAYPDVGRIELFARDSAPGWDVWGHEAPDD